LAWILLLGFHINCKVVQGDLFGVMPQVYGISERSYDWILLGTLRATSINPIFIICCLKLE
jgi:hypothetical protein